MRYKIFLMLFIIFLGFLQSPACFCGTLEDQKQDSKGKMRILFIVNPISHEIKDLDIPKIIDENLNLSLFEYRVVYTQYAQHATQLAKEALEEKFDLIAAVGGDGTVNEVGKALINTNGILAIIPVGSGNGLAKHFGIPVGLVPSIKMLNQAHPILMDTAKINDQSFLGVAGIGFDACIAKRFAEFGKRGFFSYFQVALQEFSKYEPQSYQITIDGKQIFRRAFILTFANSSQYGNDFVIAPNAMINDGYLDLVIVNPISGPALLKFIYKLRFGKLNHLSSVETYRFKEITIQPQTVQGHIDGEPVLFQNGIKVKVLPNSLKVMVPSIPM